MAHAEVTVRATVALGPAALATLITLLALAVAWFCVLASTRATRARFAWNASLLWDEVDAGEVEDAAVLPPPSSHHHRSPRTSLPLPVGVRATLQSIGKERAQLDGKAPPPPAAHGPSHRRSRSMGLGELSGMRTLAQLATEHTRARGRASVSGTLQHVGELGSDFYSPAAHTSVAAPWPRDSATRTAAALAAASAAAPAAGAVAAATLPARRRPTLSALAGSATSAATSAVRSALRAS
ncbi:hypothetical protein T492DRAFT_862406, partial [Pavlovales sp. CCMP2436]